MDSEQSKPTNVGSNDQLGGSEPKRCTEREKCQGDATRYDTVSNGVYSLTLKCRACGFIVRRDWD